MGSATRGATRNWQRIQAVHLNPDQTDTRQERLLTLLSWLPSSPFAGEAPRRFGKIRAFLAGQSTPIGPYDLQIGAIALAAV